METPEVKTTATAASLAEHKALRTGGEVPATTAPPAQDPEPVQPAKAAEPEPQTEIQEAEKPKRDRTAQGRAKELLAEGRTDEALKILEEAAVKKAGARSPAPAPPPPEPAKPKAEEPKAAPDTNSKPKLNDFLKGDTKTYEEAHDEWEEAVHKWRTEQQAADARKAEEEKKTQTIRESAARKAADARAKYTDFEEVTAGDPQAGTGLILTPAMQQFVLHTDDGMEVAYYLGKHPEEYGEIKQLEPVRQIAALGAIAHKIASSSTPAPDKPVTPVSRAPKPPQTVGGVGAPQPKALAEASSMAEYKKLRAVR